MGDLTEFAEELLAIELLKENKDQERIEYLRDFINKEE
jgi:hypothetical protein